MTQWQFWTNNFLFEYCLMKYLWLALSGTADFWANKHILNVRNHPFIYCNEKERSPYRFYFISSPFSKFEKETFRYNNFTKKTLPAPNFVEFSFIHFSKISTNSKSKLFFWSETLASSELVPFWNVSWHLETQIAYFPWAVNNIE